jgi:hypothetical protein
MFPKMSPRNPGKICLLGSHDGSCEQNSVIGLYSDVVVRSADFKHRYAWY